MQQCLNWYVSCAIWVKKAAQTTKVLYKGQPDIRDTFKSPIAPLISGFYCSYRWLTKSCPLTQHPGIPVVTSLQFFMQLALCENCVKMFCSGHLQTTMVAWIFSEWYLEEENLNKLFLFNRNNKDLLSLPVICGEFFPLVRIHAKGLQLQVVDWDPYLISFLIR